MWDYRLLRDEHGLRIVKAYHEEDQVAGYAEADPHTGETVDEVRRDLNRAWAATMAPILVERDGKLVEETHG